MKNIGSLFMVAAVCGTTAAAQAPAIPTAEQAAIVATALDYGDGFYSGAPERMERALHPDLNKVTVQALAQTGRYIVGYSTYSGLIEMTRAKVALLAPEKRKIQGSALSMVGDIALARVTSAMFNDFLTMVKVDGLWKIVNVIWVPGPDAPNRPTFPVADALKDNDAITRAMTDFIRGVQTSDATLLEKVLHPEVSMCGFGASPGAKPAITRTRYSGIVEAARAKMIPVLPEAARTSETKIIDAMDGMALVEVTLPNSFFAIQMANLGGEWKILNILNKRIAPRK